MRQALPTAFPQSFFLRALNETTPQQTAEVLRTLPKPPIVEALHKPYPRRLRHGLNQRNPKLPEPLHRDIPSTISTKLRVQPVRRAPTLQRRLLCFRLYMYIHTCTYRERERESKRQTNGRTDRRTCVYIHWITASVSPTKP